jgi:23S rRNA (uracil1939-C5)-methyltransferase
MRTKGKHPLLSEVRLTDYAAEGKALLRLEGKVVFVSGGVPGDLVDVQLTKNKKDWAEGRVVRLVEPAPDRLQPFCIHFGTCGGCKWQMLPYEKQLLYKQQEVEQNLRRIGKVELPEIMPILGSAQTTAYRNKLEFTFSTKRYLTEREMNLDQPLEQMPALGYHAPRLFDKVIDITECHLMDPVNNRIRNTIRDYAKQHELSYYDIRMHTGWLRNIIIRYTTLGELMVNICINHEDEPARRGMLDHLLQAVPEITTLLYTINPKFNDTLQGLEPVVYSGSGQITEVLGGKRFLISPKSFFQTNSRQAEILYDIVRSFSGLTGKETVYDLYCGTGSIGLFVSDGAKKIIGVEVVEDAIADAKKNAALNDIHHAHFFAGDVIKICDDAFFQTHGKPDLVITDPPRAGMHEKLVNKLLDMEAPRMVYVSCNSATMARDLALLAEKYRIDKVQPVDMFPHTHHIECVVLLSLHTTSTH